MSTDQLRQAIRGQLQAALARRQARSTTSSANAAQAADGSAVVVPLRLSCAEDVLTLIPLFKRLAALPSLLQMVEAGLLRFDLQVDAAVAQSLGSSNGVPVPACCGSCQSDQICQAAETVPATSSCGATPGSAATAPILKGVVGERQVKALTLTVQAVRLDPKAVLTPLGKEALRKRGIAIEKGGATS